MKTTSQNTISPLTKPFSPKHNTIPKSPRQPPYSPSTKTQTKSISLKDQPSPKHHASHHNNHTTTHQSPSHHPSCTSNSPKTTANVHHLGQSTQPQGHTNRRDIRARYWAYLFDNLRRAVDEIYMTCEADESIIECKVVFQSHNTHSTMINSKVLFSNILNNNNNNK